MLTRSCVPWLRASMPLHYASLHCVLRHNVQLGTTIEYELYTEVSIVRVSYLAVLRLSRAERRLARSAAL